MTISYSQRMEWVLYSHCYSRGTIFQNLRFKAGGCYKFDSKIHFGCFLGCWVWCLYHSGGISEHPEPGYRDEETSSVRICTVFWWSLWQGYRALSSRKHQGKQKPLTSSAYKTIKYHHFTELSSDNRKENIFQAENCLGFFSS